MDDGAALLEQYRRALCGVPITHVWRGYDTAIFLEFGELTPKLRKDGTPGNPDGEFSAMIEGSWRIEEADYIACGSSSAEEFWDPWLPKLLGKKVIDIATFGRLPELMLSLSEDLYIATFATEQDGPEWALMDHRDGGLANLISRHGRIGPEHKLSGCF